MNYLIKTNREDGLNYVYVKAINIESALSYAVEATQCGCPPLLRITTEDNDEVCIVVNGCCYQMASPNKIIETERSVQ